MQNLAMKYQYLIGLSVKGFVKSRIVQVSDEGILVIEHEIKGARVMTRVDLCQVEIVK